MSSPSTDRHYRHRRRRTRRTRRTAVAAAASALAMLTMGLIAPSSQAATPTPAPFTNCPVDYTNPTTGAGLNTCIAAVGLGGSFTLGKSTVTLTPGTNLQGGLALVNGGLGFIPATDGMTLSGPAQSVPGGLLGIAAIQNLLPGITNVKALVTLVGPVDFKLGQNIDITLPIQVQLQNSLLGRHCAIGSAAHPIVLHLTTGTTAPPAGVAPITGTPGTASDPGLGAPVLEFAGQTLVDNTFSVPGAHGCAGDLLDPIVNAKTGLPAAAGRNSATMITNSFLVAAADVGEVTGYNPGS